MKGIVAALLLILPASADAQRFGGAATATPTTVTLNVTEQVGIDVATGVPPNQNTAGKTPVVSNPSISTLGIILIGDSIAAHPAPTMYAPVNPILQLDIYNGTVYPAIEPLLGESGGSVGGSYSTPLADKVYGKFAQVILIPTAIGGSTALDHTPSGVLNQVSRAACFQVRAKGWLANPNFKFAIIYDVGPNDTGIGTTQAQWQARYVAWRASMVSYGCDFDTFVPLVSRLSGATSAAIRAGQASVVDNVRTFAAWDMDAITAVPANVQADQTHQTRAGNLAVASQGNTIMRAHF